MLRYAIYFRITQYTGFFVNFRHKIIGSFFCVNFEVLFQSGILLWWYFNVKSNISMKNEKVFFAENQLLRERFKVTLKEIGKEKIILKFFHRFRFFYLDTFWYNDRYWKPSPWSTLHDFNDGLAIFDDLT